MALNSTVMDCAVMLPNNVLSAIGLSTPFQLQPPCSMAIATQQGFAEAAIFDSSTNQGLLRNGPNTDNGSLVPYCNGIASIAPPFFKGFETLFLG
jgi:hypothetical protein